MRTIEYTQSEVDKLENSLETIQEMILIRDFSVSRPSHVLNVYFLGKKLLSPFFNHNTLIPVERSESNYVNFNFIWELIALFHDYGYCFQNESNMRLYNPNKVYEIFNCEIIPYLRQDIEFYSKTYKPIDYSDYYGFVYQNRYNQKYCGYESNIGGSPNEICDHGVLGAIKMYETIINGDYFHKRKYNDETLMIAFYTIAQHNIYKLSGKQIKSYKGFTNPDHFKNGIYKIDGRSDYLSYLLCFIDSIEPIKKLYNSFKDDSDLRNSHEIEKLLKAFIIKTDGKGTIKIDYSLLEKCCDKFNLDSWLNGVIGMKDFMKIKIKNKKIKKEIKIKLIINDFFLK